MSEEAQQTDGAAIEHALPTVESTQETDSGSEQQVAQPTNGKAPGYDPIDFDTASPAEVKTRFDYLYRQIKDQKRTDSALKQYKQVAQEQSRRIEELTNVYTGVVSHLQDKSFTESESVLTQQMQVAFESGDTKTYLDAQNKLIDLKADKKLAATQKKTAPKQEVQQQQFDSDDALPPEDQRVVDTWQDERDESGILLRPWAHNKSNDPNNPDPEYMAALSETFSVLRNPRLSHLTMEQKMAEVDRRMGVKKTTPKQNVMGGGLTGNRISNKITLSTKQQEIAIRTKFAGPKAKSDAEHLDAYRKQIEQSKKGARK